MYRLKMAVLRRIMLSIGAAVCLVSLAACGSDGAVETTASVSAAAPGEDQSDESNAGQDDEDHDDDDHGDEDHDKDHDDDDEHDDHDDHGDEDHDDEDHDDDEHDDHDDHDEASGSLGAHVHGEAELSVAWSGSDVVIDLISPTDNVFGFEYEPTTDDDVALADERTKALTAPGLLVFNPEAGCTLAGDPDTNIVFEGSHAEITASWFFACDNPDQIATLDTGPLFAEFPGFVDIDAQWASDSSQSAAELSASSTVLRFG